MFPKFAPRSVLAPTVLGIFFLILTAAPAGAAEIGSKIGNFQIADSSGESWSLRSYSGKTVVLLFWSYKCPVSLSYDSRFEELRKKYVPKGAVIIGIDSNSNESPEEIRENLENRKMNLQVLSDPEGNAAEKLGASHSPCIFIIDGDSVLRYKGALDNNRKPGEAGRTAFAEDALEAVLQGQEVKVTETNPVGCRIKQRAGIIGR